LATPQGPLQRSVSFVLDIGENKFIFDIHIDLNQRWAVITQAVIKVVF